MQLELHQRYYAPDDPPGGAQQQENPTTKEVLKNRCVTRALPFQMRPLSEVQNDLLSDLGGLCLTQSIWTVKNEASGQPNQLMMIGGHSDTSTESDALKFLWRKTAVSGIPMGSFEFLGYQSYRYPHKNADSDQDEIRSDDVRVYTLTLPPILSPLVVNPGRDKIRRIISICPREMFTLFESGKIEDPQNPEQYKIPDNLQVDNNQGVVFPAKFSPQAAQELIANASIKFELETVEKVMKFYLDNIFSGKLNKNFNQIKDRWKQDMKRIHSQVKGKDALIRTQELLRKTFEGIEDLYPDDPSGESKPREQMVNDFCKWYEHALFHANLDLVEHTGPQQAFIIEHGLSADNIFAQGNYERVEHNARNIFPPLFDTAWATFGINRIDTFTAMGQRIKGQLVRTADPDWLKNTREDMTRCRKLHREREKELTEIFLHRLNITQSEYNRIADTTDDLMAFIIGTLGENVQTYPSSKDRSLSELFYSLFNIGPTDKRGEITEYTQEQRSDNWRWATLFMTIYQKYPSYQEKIALPHDHFDNAFAELVEKTDTEAQTVEIDTHTYTRHRLKQSLVPQTVRVETEEETKEIPLPQDVPLWFLSLWRKKGLESFGRKYLERGDEDLTYINDYFGRQIVPEIDTYLDSIWEQIKSYEVSRDDLRKSLAHAITVSILNSYKDSLDKQNGPVERIRFNKKGVFKNLSDIEGDDNYNGGSGAGDVSDTFDFFKVVQTSRGVQEELQIVLDPRTKIEDDKRYDLERILYPARVPAGNFALLFVLFGRDKDFYERMLRKHLGD